MITLKKACLIALITFSVQSCTTLEIAHSDLKLPCVPSHDVYFTESDMQSISNDLFDKFEKIILTYRQRIISQCEIAGNHNKAHE